MTKQLSVTYLAKLAGVSVQAVYQWIEKCAPELELKEFLGDLTDGGRFPLTAAVEILRAGKREALAHLVSEMAIIQQCVPDSPEPEYMGEVVLVTEPKPGRPAKKTVSIWIALDVLAGGYENRKFVLAALYKAGAMLTMIRDVQYAAMDSVPLEILRPYIDRTLPADEPDLLEYKRNHTNQFGELWVHSEDIAEALGWNRSHAIFRGSRTAWLGRRSDEKPGYEYDLCSLPLNQQKWILKYLVRLKPSHGGA